MRTETKEVRSSSKVVGIAEYVVCETLSEATTQHGEAKCLELINQQNRTNVLNELRASKTGTPSKAAMTQRAWAGLTQEEFMAVAGDESAIANLIASKVAGFEKEIADAKANAPIESAEPDNVDEDELG